MKELALQKTLHDIIEEYDDKISDVNNAIEKFDKAGDDIKTAACVFGQFGNTYNRKI